MSAHEISSSNVCVECGACCASYRVSFYWYEAVANGLSTDMTRQISPLFSCMAGTECKPVRCVALQGDVGDRVSCRVYEQRPSPCREVQPGDEKCVNARLKKGLSPLSVITLETVV